MLTAHNNIFCFWCGVIRRKNAVSIYLQNEVLKLFYRTFQSSMSLLVTGNKEVKKGLEENIMTFGSSELISVKITLFDGNSVRSM